MAIRLHMAVIRQMAKVAYIWQNLQTNGSNNESKGFFPFES
jgi:hypothetical protein